ncbi:MAG: hypothetical protein NC192_10945 [Muribaculaceae bacterium]|nr:hypothetical protein [Muribaculaceae bacterium]
MTCPKSVRTAAIVSQAFIVAWAVLSFLASVYQKELAYQLFIQSKFIENIGKIVPAVSIALCFEGILLSAANVLMCRGKKVYAPLVTTAVTIGIFPFITVAVNFVRWNNHLADSNYTVAYVNSVSEIESILSYLLNIAAIITVAAAAVYAYAKNREKEESGESYTEYDMRYTEENDFR